MRSKKDILADYDAEMEKIGSISREAAAINTPLAVIAGALLEIRDLLKEKPTN